MIFIDTTIWVAAIDSSDELHEDGKSTLNALIERKLSIALTTDYVLDEVMTILKKRKIPPKKIISVIESIIESPLVEVIFVDEQIFTEALKIFKKYEKLSFTDSTTLAVMRKYKIKEIYSHDSDFDLSGITRRERPP
ncbi:MAG: type II toxin-antitoxin system VapC family toxin [Candidatus Odinarchaeota archaeon]|nr:type II toxin-antitoxin system VapC family toxin [Candidatus Odinarchaeota archaeon]